MITAFVILGYFARDYFVSNLAFIPSNDEEHAVILVEVAAHDENIFWNKPYSQGS